MDRPHDMITICMMENENMVEIDSKACPSIWHIVIFFLIENIVTLEIRGLSQTFKNLLKSNFEFKIT